MLRIVLSTWPNLRRSLMKRMRDLRFIGGLLCALCFFSSTASAEIKTKWGSAFRLREEYWKNWKDVDNDQKDNRNFFRVKSSLWGQVDFNENIALHAKLTNEFKAYTYFAGTSGAVPDKSATKKGYHFDINEIVFDNLYADFKNTFGAPIDVRIGRQDFLGTYGEGFLIMDGTPQDGSRTFYFNAAKASWRANNENTIDFVYLNDPRTDEFLPVINRLRLPSATNPLLGKTQQVLNTTDEQGFVLDWKTKTIKNLLLENYYIYKREDDDGGIGLQAKRGIINTFGSFAKYDFSPWTLRVQIAEQFGKYGDNDRLATGGYAFLDREFKGPRWTPRASAGFIYLSGDKAGTDKDEAWDPLFSRYPWISEFFVNTIASDTGNSIAGYWTNLQVYRTEFSFKPTTKSKISLWYNYLRANAQVAANAVCSGTGKERGHLPQLRWDYAINKNITTYILGEYFIPGNFYKDHDPGMFVRAEVLIKF